METQLTPAQSQAVRSNASNIVVVASPGSGKSMVIVERIKRLIADGVNPGTIVAISYTNAAAKVLQDRLEGQPLGFIGTLHSFLLKLLQANPVAVGFRPGFAVIDEEEKNDILMDVAKEMAYRGPVKDIVARVNEGPAVNLAVMSADKLKLVGAAFYQKLREENIVTYDTILYYGEGLLHQPGPRQQLESYTHLMWDEFQDASALDAEILCLLPIKNQMVCGDSDQAIFAFRRGAVEGLINLTMQGHWEVIRLEENFRSSIWICDKAQALIEKNKFRVSKKIICFKDRSDFGGVYPKSYESAEDERTNVAQMIRQQVTGQDKTSPKEIAVLCRTNWLAYEFAKSLTEAGLPVRKPGFRQIPEGFYRAKLFLALMAQPENDRLAFMVIKEARGQSTAEEIRLSALGQFKSINQIAIKIKKPETIAKALEYLKMMGTPLEAHRYIAEMAQTMPAGAQVEDLILALGREMVQPEENQEAITVSTIHAAKGREFEVVFLPAFEEGILPLKNSEIEEERRVAFVGMTRAKNHLILSGSKLRRAKWGELVKTKPSRFLEEMGFAKDNE